MKPVHFYLLLFYLLPFHAGAQRIHTEYYTEDRQKATPHSYAIRRDILQSDSGYVINDYNKKGKRRFSGQYASIDTMIEHGGFKFYDKQGFIEAEGTYTHGEMTGTWIFYNDDKSIRRKINYDFEKVDCALSDMSELTEMLETPDSNRTELLPVFMDGKPETFYRFLYKQLEFPPLPKMTFVTGRIIVTFYIDTEGNVCNVSTDGSANKDLEKESRRVISLSPQWQPGKLGDQPVKVIFSCPITFKFE